MWHEYDNSLPGGKTLLSGNDIMMELLEQKNKEQDGQLSSELPRHVSAGDSFSKMSSKRAMTMAGGIDHVKSSMRASALETEEQMKRKREKRAIYDSWKAALLENKKIPVV